jgi:1,4-dihydroxy-2-naphthoate octaprenyltransferase
MDMTIIIDFIRPELFILGIFLYCIGLFLKLIPAFKAEWAIPFILLTVSIATTILYVGVVLGLGWSGAMIITAFIQGVLLAALTVFANQLIKQLVVKRAQDEVTK